MATYRITDPTTKRTVKLTGDSPPTEAELNEVFKSIPSKPQQQSPSFMKQGSDALAVPNPQQFINQAAPSNLLRLAGVATANAPGMAGMVLNSLPGGNPSQIMPSLNNIQRIPGQGKVALQRIAAVNSGGPLAENEVVPARAGQVAGTILEMASPSLPTKNVKAIGPFTAGLKDPSTILPGAFEKAGQELGNAKKLARMGENSQEAAKLRVMLQKPAGVLNLAEEAKAALEAGKDIAVTKLLAYREALGKAQAEGGTFANDYAEATKLANELLKKKAPDLVIKLENMATNYAAKGKGNAVPWFTLAMNPKVGALKVATLPFVRNIAGAATNVIGTTASKTLPLINSAAKIVKEDAPIPEVKQEVKSLKLSKAKAKEFLKKAKGNKEQALQDAIKAGYDPYQ